MKKCVTKFDLFVGDKFITRGSLESVAKAVCCDKSTLGKRLKTVDECQFKEFRVVRVRGIDREEYNRMINQQKIDKQLDEYYQMVYRGLRISGKAIGKYSIAAEEQIKRLYEMGVRGDLRFIPGKEGKTRWYHIELIKAS